MQASVQPALALAVHVGAPFLVLLQNPLLQPLLVFVKRQKNKSSRLSSFFLRPARLNDWQLGPPVTTSISSPPISFIKLGSEQGDFDIADICNNLCDKLIFRHPHVYGEAQAQSAGEVSLLWEQVKQKEKDGNKTVLSGVPQSLPSLIKAYRIQDKARNVGFDWQKREDVWDKVHEEIDELRAELEKDDKENSTDEFGDLLFSLINASRLYGINPDNALERTNRKFISRFTYVEERAKEQGRELKDMTLEEMDRLWNEAKQQGW